MSYIGVQNSYEAQLSKYIRVGEQDVYAERRARALVQGENSRYVEHFVPTTADQYSFGSKTYPNPNIMRLKRLAFATSYGR